MSEQGFWTNNPCVPSWSETLGQMWSGTFWHPTGGSPPKLLEPLPLKRPVRLPQGCEIRVAVAEESGAIAEFWGRFFSISSSCRCAVSKEIVLKAMASGRWQILVAVAGDQIIGTIVRRYLKGLHVYEARWANAGVIDFFCVHPSWRGRGVGRSLLDIVHNLSALPLQPHLIFWEGLRPSVPPLACGFFWARRCGEVFTSPKGGGTELASPVKEKEEIQKAWRICVKGSDVWTEEPGDEITVWQVDGRQVVVWNTWHVTIPDGKPIGIVLSDLDGANALSTAKSPWGVLLSPQVSPIAQDGWTFDSVFQWIGYNLSVGKISTQFPRIGF